MNKKKIALSILAGVTALTIGFSITFCNTTYATSNAFVAKVMGMFKGTKVHATTNGLAPSKQIVPGRVLIDAGHGGKDPGAVGFGNEKDYNLPVALEVGRILQKYGLEVIFSRTTDVRMGDSVASDLINRTNKGKLYGVDISVSFHMNGDEDPSAEGFETFTYSRGVNELRLANAVHNHVIGTNLYVDRGVKQKDLHMCREISGPAILVEMGFISNKEDYDVVNNKDTRYLVARSVARGVLDFYGINWRGDINARYER